MKIIGLTGGVSSGKNFVAEIFRKNGAAIFDADVEVHNLLEGDEVTIHLVKKEFLESFVDNRIDRQFLGKIVFADKKKLKILEKILHPRVRKKYQEFLKSAHQEKKELAVLNIPLLLEKKGYKCDVVIAIITQKSIQKKRFLAREKAEKNSDLSGLSERFEQIFSHQISNSERISKADFVVKNDLPKNEVRKQILGILKEFIQK